MERARRHKTRNQRKRIHDAVLAVAMVVFWLVVGAYSLKVWATHPAEQPVNGQEYLASLRVVNADVSS